MSQFRPISEAPHDGTPIQAVIPGNGSDNIIAWEMLGPDWGGWCFVEDQEPPDCWTDGICWEINENLEQSVQPTHFKTPPQGDS